MGTDRPALEGSVDWERVARQRLAIYTIAGFVFFHPRPADQASSFAPVGHALAEDWEFEGPIDDTPDWIYRSRKAVRDCFSSTCTGRLASTHTRASCRP